MAYGRWKPSNANRIEFANKMKEIDDFCSNHEIQKSLSSDSYYFSVNGQKYRVSNHSIEASNKHAFNFDGVQIRDLYHENGRDNDVVYIHASKTRIIDIYNDLCAGYKLDGRGNRVI